MKITILCVFSYMLILLLSCNDINNEEMNFPEISNIPPCNTGYEVIKVLKDEPAFVNKRCMDIRYLNDDNIEYDVRIDTFCLDLVNIHSEFFSIAGLFPCGEIPEQYRKDNLSVYISGNVTNSWVLGGCSEPNIKVASIPVFELTAIKINNNKK